MSDGVGKFPAEDMVNIQSTSLISSTYCTSSQLNLDPIKLKLNRNLNQEELKMIEKAPELILKRSSNEIYVLDIPSKKTESALVVYFKNGTINLQEFNKVFLDKKKFKPYCPNKNFLLDLTEGYWAGKGTSVIHHWAHLFSPLDNITNLSSQYGSLVSFTSFSLWKIYDGIKIKRLIELAWWMYFIIGVLYIYLFILYFKKELASASFFMALKITLFYKIGSLAIFTAPGFHWSRELCLIAPVIIFNQYMQIDKNKLSTPKKIFLCAFLLLLSFLLISLDSFFSLISIFLIILSSVIINYEELLRWFKKFNKKYLYFFTIVFVLFASYFLISMMFQNFSYIISLQPSFFRALDVSADNARYSLLTILSGLIFLFYLKHKNQKDKFPAYYFSLTTIITSLYFFITPDNFHFYKSQEFAMPFYLLVFLEAKNYFKRFSRENHFQNLLKNIGFLLLIFIAIFLVFSLFKFTKPSMQQEIVFNSYGNKFYSNAKKFQINGKEIEANLSDEAAMHLNNFQKVTGKYDFVLSPFDKYILFLYEKNNGFSRPDFISSLTHSELDQVLDKFSNMTNFKIVIDDYIFDLSYNARLLSSHMRLGYLSRGHTTALQARIHAEDFGYYLINSCTKQENESIPGWGVYVCNFHTKKSDPKNQKELMNIGTHQKKDI